MERNEHLPLEGIRIVDLTVVWSGPGSAMLLGDLGAEVIRVECLTRASRQIPSHISKEQVALMGYAAGGYPDFDPGERPYNRSAFFNWHARNKLSVTFPPLETPEGREAMLRLVAVSDVFVENNSAPTIPKLRLDYEDLAAVNPRLIMVRMAPLGLSGEMTDYIGYGPNFNSLVGIGAMDGYEGEDPTSAGENYHMDEAAPAGVAFAVLAALWEREETGKGCLIEFPQSENLIQEVGEYVLDRQMNNRDPKVWGNGHPTMLQGVFATADEDRWLALSIRDDRDWVALRDVLGDDDGSLAAGNDARVRLAEVDSLRAAIEKVTRSRHPEQLVPALQAAGVPAAEVLRCAQLFDDPHLEDRQWFQTRSHPETGEHRYPGHPWRASEFDLRWGRPLPALGEDNEYVFKTVMGYTDEEYEAGVKEGSIGVDQRA